jgi:hypothetical protein
MWTLMERAVDAHNCTDAEDLKAAWQKEWDAYPQATIGTCIKMMEKGETSNHPSEPKARARRVMEGFRRRPLKNDFFSSC